MIVILLTRDTLDTWAAKFEYPFTKKLQLRNNINSKSLNNNGKETLFKTSASRRAVHAAGVRCGLRNFTFFNTYACQFFWLLQGRWYRFRWYPQFMWKCFGFS